MTAYDTRPRLEITSPANPRIKWLVSLRRRRTRDAERLTLVEGYDELTLALDAGVSPRQVYWCPDLARDAGREKLLARVAALHSDVVPLGTAAFSKASYREGPDGWLAVVDEPDVALDEIALGQRALVLVCESVEKPGNLGAMLRTAEAVGADAVVAASAVTDWGNPNIVRASKGTVFAVPVASAPGVEVAGWLRRNAVRIVVATPDAPTLVTDLDLTGPTAIVVGAEHAGVSSQLRAAADLTAALPMAGRVNSLNVAASAAVLLYEAVRQRTSRR
jgi:TrmH family RNA methyltransferase